MKRLFKSNKPGGIQVDPLPPPLPPNTAPIRSPSPPQQKRSLVNILANGTNGDHQHHSHHQPHNSYSHGYNNHESTKPRHGVTPFPMDLGRDSNSNAAYQPNGSLPGQVSSPSPTNAYQSSRKGKGRDRGSSGIAPSATAPSLLEIQRIQAASDERELRRDQWVASQQRASPLPPGSASAHSPIVSGKPGTPGTPEGWTMVPTPNGMPTPGEGARSMTPPNGHSFFLPPGARPPSPQQQSLPQPIHPSVQVRRPSTPPSRPPYAHSQSSYTTSQGPHDMLPPPPPPGPQPSHRTRDRGYSSASGSLRGSDQEGSTNLNHQSLQSHQHRASLVSGQNNRSPLGYEEGNFPQPHPYTPPTPPRPHQHPTQAAAAAVAAPSPKRQQQVYSPLVEEMAAINVEGPTPTEDDTPREGGKKKFWGMSKPTWTDRRPKESEEGSRFIEDFGNTSAPASTQGHGDEEQQQKSNKLLGLDFSALRGREGKDQNQAMSHVDNVTAAIQILCAHPDPPFSSSFEICERINLSKQPDSVSKEAAHALRKQLKHGNEAERKAAANLWLIMMRNITTPSFRSHATSKKFMASLEPILLAPPNKPLVSIPTRKVIVDIVGDLTYSFGTDKGCEALLDLWKKIKLPQESDYGVPLPQDHQIFTPDSFYGSQPGFYPMRAASPSSMPNSRHSPNPFARPTQDDVPPPMHVRGPMAAGGPHLTALPDHGDDMRRLMDECTAAKESARVLAEALVYTRPEELEGKPVIHEFYRKCFLAHESLTGQIQWAQAEASQSRERVLIQARMEGSDDEVRGSTMEEEALNILFEAHSQLGEVLKQHDDLERMAMDEKELREVRERSKKDMRMDRNAIDGLNVPTTAPTASSSRSPSPAPAARLPDHSPHRSAAPLPIPAAKHAISRSRTPSPDRLPNRLSSSPRQASPLGLHNPQANRHSRPLPNPSSFYRGGDQSSLSSSLPRDSHNHPHPVGSTNPSRSGTGSTNDSAPNALTRDDEGDEEVRTKPSRKALGKRRAAPPDPDNNFDPDDMFKEKPKTPSPNESTESLIPDEAYLKNHKPVKYAYDAYQEKLEAENKSRENSDRGGDHSTTVRIGQGSSAQIE